MLAFPTKILRTSQYPTLALSLRAYRLMVTAATGEVAPYHEMLGAEDLVHVDDSANDNGSGVATEVLQPTIDSDGAFQPRAALAGN